MRTKSKKGVSVPFDSSQDILTRAMLVRAHMGVWEARKHDREVTDKVNAEYAANAHAGRYHKHLFGGPVPELGELLTAAGNVRQTHIAQTLPWSDVGWRILPTSNYFSYTEVMRKAIALYDAAADRFTARYPQLVHDARAKLNGMYREEDYPSAASVRAKYYAITEYSPLPAGSDFRVSLPGDELKAMAETVEARVVASVKDAMNEAWNRLAEAVHALQIRLGTGKYLRDPMVARVRAVAETLGRLNLTDDPNLERIRQQVLRDLSTLDVEVLREDEDQRRVAAEKAAQIVKAMQGFYTPTPQEEKADAFTKEDK